VRNVTSCVRLNWNTETQFLTKRARILMIVKLLELHSEVTDRTTGHEVAFHIAGLWVITLAIDDVLFAVKFFSQTLLFVLFISAESFRDVYCFHLATLSSDKNSFAISSITYVQFVTDNNSYQCAASHVRRLREPSVET
jgi:hypothetical protein